MEDHRRVASIFRKLVRRAQAIGWLKGQVRLVWGRPQDFPKSRDYAFASATRVVVAPKMALADRARVRGLLAHELGHVCALQARIEHSERQADQIGKRILRGRLGYDAEDVQREGLRRKRPGYLHQ